MNEIDVTKCPCYINRPLHRHDKGCLIQTHAFSEQQTVEKPILRCDEIKNCPIKEHYKQLHRYKQAIEEIKEIAEPFCNACQEFEPEKRNRNCVYCNYGSILQKNKRGYKIVAFKRLNDLRLIEEYCCKPVDEICPIHNTCYDNEFQCKYWKQVWKRHNNDFYAIRQGNQWYKYKISEREVKNENRKRN